MLCSSCHPRRFTVVIVGHSSCGGAQACLGAAARANGPTATTIDSLPETDPLNRWLAPLTILAASLQLSTAPTGEAISLLVEENVKMQVENLAKSETIAKAWASKSGKGKDVWIHGWVYDLASGKLRDLGVTRGPLV